jgi:hypothetical protein
MSQRSLANAVRHAHCAPGTAHQERRYVLIAVSRKILRLAACPKPSVTLAALKLRKRGQSEKDRLTSCLRCRCEGARPLGHSVSTAPWRAQEAFATLEAGGLSAVDNYGVTDSKASDV